MRKLLTVTVFALTLTSGMARAAEMDINGAYTIPSGSFIDSVKQAGTAGGVSVTTGGISGDISFLFGSSSTLLGFELGYLPLVSYTGGSARYIPILFQVKHSSGAIFLTGGAGFSEAEVTLGNLTVSSSTGSFTVMGGAGLSTGGNFGFELGAKAYYVFASAGNTLCLAPFAGIHVGL